MNVSTNFFPAGGFGMAWIVGGFILTAIVHVSFAFAVLTDSGLLFRRLRRNTFLVSGGVWALATLIGGVFVAAVYWLVHHSTLRPPQPTDVPTQDPIGSENRKVVATKRSRADMDSVA